MLQNIENITKEHVDDWIFLQALLIFIQGLFALFMMLQRADYLDVILINLMYKFILDYYIIMFSCISFK